MSHEGIRIVSEDEARRDAEQGSILSAAATTPAKVRVMKSQGTGVSIEWKDGHDSSWPFAWLRQACPCALCNEEREQTKRSIGAPKPRDSAPLALYEAPPRPLEVTRVGNYALRFKWNDGHQSGIYSWEYLRRVCQCELCRRVSP